MARQPSPVPSPLPPVAGFQSLETLPDDFAEQLGRYALEPGDVIAERFKLLERLGGGAMGQVFLAENKTIGLRVAVKLLKPELLASVDFRTRFRHEAQAVSAIQHPNVARFYDLVIGDPTFLVMEYVPGPTLAEVLEREGPLPPRRAAELAVRIAWGLHAAHRAGVVHRDLKPANILLTADEQHGELPKIIDFGLAKTSASKQAPLTRTGQLIGTPEYMAPEQIAAKGAVDARADVYSLGCVLYEMLSGRTPFVAQSEDLQVLYQQVHEPADPITRHAAHVPATLEAVVARALEKDPEQRYPSMREFAQALARAVDRRQRPREPSVETQVMGARRIPTVYIALGFALLTLLLAGALAFRGLRAPAPRVVAAAPPATAASLLAVSTEPEGASVELDGRPLAESTPTALRGLPAGKHTVHLVRAGREPVTREVELPPGGRRVLEVQLGPSMRTLEVRTVPPGAQLFLDDNLQVGRTPLRVSATLDDYHELRIELTGYETKLVHLRPDSPPLQPVVLEAERLPRGQLLVDASGPAEVLLDGETTGFTTPTPAIRVSSGEHKVQLRGSSGAVGPASVVHVRQGETVRLMLAAPKEAR